jgi:hypothetical protein
MGHKTSWESCEFVNTARTSVIDVMVSVFQLTIGLNMAQVIAYISSTTVILVRCKGTIFNPAPKYVAYLVTKQVPITVL